MGRTIKVILITLLFLASLSVNVAYAQQDGGSVFIPIEINPEYMVSTFVDADGDGIDDSVDDFVDVDGDGYDDRTGLTQDQVDNMSTEGDHTTIGDVGDILDGSFDDSEGAKYDNLKPDELIELIRTGEPYVMRYVKHKPLAEAVEWLRTRGELFFLDPELYYHIDDVIVALMEIERPEVRAKITQSLTSGIFNLDPQVRLVTLKLLRRLIPDTAMRILIFYAAGFDESNKLYTIVPNREAIISMKSETVGRPTLIEILEEDHEIIEYLSLGSQYRISDLKGKEVHEYAYIELVKLACFTIRRELMAEMLVNPEMMKDINVNLFYLLSWGIDDEDLHKISTFNATPEYINAYGYGMMHENEEVGEESAKALVRMMRKRSTPDEIRTAIFQILRESPYWYLIFGGNDVHYFDELSSGKGVHIFLNKNGKLPDSNFKWNDRYDLKREDLYKIGAEQTSWVFYNIVPGEDWVRADPMSDDDINEADPGAEGDLEEFTEDAIPVVIPNEADAGDITGEGFGEGTEEFGEDDEAVEGAESDEDDPSDSGQAFDEDLYKDGFWKLDVTITPEETGTVTVTPESTDDTYEDGTEVTVVAEFYDGYAFSHWEGDATGTEPTITIIMDSDKDIVAVFGEDKDGDGKVDGDWKLNINIYPPDSGTVTVTPEPTDGTYENGTEVTLIAEPKEGYAFDHWEHDATGDDATTIITMTSNKSVTAVFGEDKDGDGKVDSKWTLTVDIDPAGSGTVTVNPEPDENGKYEDDEEVTLTATPSEGFVFDHWEDDLTGGDANTTIVMDSDKNIKAVFVVDKDTGIGISPFSEPGDFFDIENPTKIRFLNGVYDSPDLELIINDESSGSVKFQRITNFAVFPAGTYHIQVNLAGTDTVVMDLGDVELKVYKEYTIVALGFLSGSASGAIDTTLDIMTIEDDLLDLTNDPNKSELRILNTVPVDIAIDVEIVKSDGTKVKPEDMQNIKYKDWTQYLELQPGTYIINLYAAGTDKLLTTTSSFVVEPGRRYLLVAFVPLGGLDTGLLLNPDDFMIILFSL